MSTKTYTGLWKYMPGNTGLLLSIPYQALPVDSEFQFFGTIGIEYANGAAVRVNPENCTFSGYDMTTPGFQTVSMSYVDQYGKTLTNTYTLHVFGDSTWRTIWEGYENIYFDNGKFYVNGVESTQSSGQGAFSCPIDAGVFNQYIGTTSTRTIKITYELPNVGFTNEVYILNESQQVDTAPHTVVGSFNWDTQAAGTIWSRTTNYSNVYKTFAVNNYDDGLVSGYNKNQMIVGQIDSEYTEAYGLNLLCWHVYAADANKIPESTVYNDYASIRLNRQNIVIRKIEVLE